MNIIDPILFQARVNPEGLAICTPDARINSVTYGRLIHMVNNIARRAHWEGLRRGERVAISIKEKIFHAATILALTRIGIVTVSARSRHLPKELAIDAIISDSPGPFENASKQLVADLGWTEGDGKPMADERVYQSSADDICRIALTSGTTGKAKGVAFTHRMIVERNSRYLFIKGNRFSYSSRLYCDLGLASNPGFRLLVYMLTKGGTIFFYGESPESMLQAFDLYKIQNMFISTGGLAEYVKFFENHSEFQCNFDSITSGGSIISRSLAKRVRARMSPNLYSAYGATEACTMAMAPMHQIEHIAGAVGWVAPGVAVEIVDETGRELPPETEGIVRIRSPYVVKEYVGDPPSGRQALRDGYFYPGDLARLTKEALLVISGREGQVLNLGGDKVAAEIVEEALKSFAGVEDAAVITISDALGVPKLCAAIVSRTALDEDALRDHCARKIELGFAPHLIVRVERIPRNEMGKIERNRIRDLLEKVRP